MIILTPIGPMQAIGDDTTLLSLQFIPHPIPSPDTPTTRSIANELDHYFKGTLKHFQTPLHLCGTSFQIRVWKELQKIPYGTTHSYAQLALSINQATACRAVAQANKANKFPIIIPCHRVINSDGKLGGYNSGPTRKQWLLNHER